MDIDAVIVGGGPAGCSTALGLLAAGYSAAVISAPNRRQKPTETAVAALPDILRSLGASKALDACEPCFGICSGWGRSAPVLRPSLVDPRGHAWFIHRGRFDSCLQDTARNAGAIWIEGKARSVDFDAHGVSVTTTSKPIRARWIILATGSPSWPARITQQRPSTIDSLISFWANLPTRLEARLLFVEPTDCGWWYVCPGDGDGAIACFVTDPLSARALGASQTRNWNNLFQTTTLFQRLEGDPSGSPVYAAPTGLGELPQKAGPRWIAVGDAAVKLDPIGSAGTTTALDSGRRAAEAVADALEGNATSTKSYRRWSTDLVEEFARQRWKHYAIEAWRRPDGFWTRRAHCAR